MIGLAILSVVGCQTTDCCDDGGASSFFLWGSSHCDPCAEIADGAIPQPVGSTVDHWRCAQANAAEQGKLVIYNYEFLCDSADLSPFGRRHVQKIAPMTTTMAAPVIVQPSDDSELDQARRVAVSEKLATFGVIDADNRVVLAYPQADGLYGFEAPQVVNGLLRGGRGQTGGGRGQTGGGRGQTGGGRGGMGGGMGGTGGGGMGRGGMGGGLGGGGVF